MYKLMYFGYCFVLDIVWIISNVMDIVITVSRLTWMTTKINGVAIDLFYTGVISHS